MIWRLWTELLLSFQLSINLYFRSSVEALAVCVVLSESDELRPYWKNANLVAISNWYTDGPTAEKTIMWSSLVKQ